MLIIFLISEFVANCKVNHEYSERNVSKINAVQTNELCDVTLTDRIIDSVLKELNGKTKQ